MLRKVNVLNRGILWTKSLLQHKFFIHDANSLELTRHEARVSRIFYTSRTSIDCVVFRIDIDTDGGLGIIVELDTFLKLIDNVLHLPISQMYNKFNGMTKIQNKVFENGSDSKHQKEITKCLTSPSELVIQHQPSGNIGIEYSNLNKSMLNRCLK